MSTIHSIVQIQPNVVLGHCCIDIQLGKQKQVRRVFQKIKAEWPVKLFDYYVNLQGGFSRSYLEDQFLALKKLARYLEDAQWYVYDEGENIYSLQIKKGVFTYKHIEHTYGDFLKYYQATFPKDTKVIFSLLENRIYQNTDIAHSDKVFFDNFQKDVQAALKIDPTAWDILQSYGVALSNKGEHKKAASAARRALRIKHSINKHDDYDSLLLYSNLANDLVADKQYEAGLKCVARAEHIIPNRGDYRILEKKAYAYLGLKNFEMVIKTCDEIIRKSLRRDDIAYAFFNKACALTMLQRYGESAASLATAYTMNPRLPVLAENDPENIMIFKLLLKNSQVKDVMGETYKYMEKFI
jgi:tetratricopeptide (TPR) repeat protein